MEQDDKGLKMEPLLCDPPALLTTLTLTLTPEGTTPEPETGSGDSTLTLTLPQATQMKPLNVR